MTKDVLHIDLETYCELDVNKVGVYRYAQHPSFEILLFAFAWNDGRSYCVDVAGGEEVPEEVLDALTDETVIKMAHNANFEFVCLHETYGDLIIDQWRCTMIAAAYLGLPLGLDKISKVLHLTEQKDARGKVLIRYFCQPCKPTKTNGGRTRNMPDDAPEFWIEFKGYNTQDVRVEQAIDKYTERFEPLPLIEWRYWWHDQQINSVGTTIDVPFIRRAIDLNRTELAKLHQQIIDLTGVTNPNSTDQLRTWASAELDEAVKSIGKKFLDEALAENWLPENVKQLFELRQKSSKTSVSKYDAMLRYKCDDGRIRGLLQFYGANRTGRYAGRGVQLQNLKRTFSSEDALYALAASLGASFDDVKGIVGNALETAKKAVLQDVAQLLYDDVPTIISKLVRTALIASPGCTLAVSDFAGIEARVLAWLAGEGWAMEVFRTHGKIYEATASRMFNVPLEAVTKGSKWRKDAKTATLALGYQGNVGAMVTSGALEQGLTMEELPAIVYGWRAANPNIVKLWRKVENAVRHVLCKKTSYTLKLPSCELVFKYDRGYLFITLPSGRRLAYYGAKVEAGKITYWGVDQTKKIWVRIKTYGGSLVENITQAIARDCLADAMLRMGEKDICILFHIHDEIVSECHERDGALTLAAMEKIMSVSPAWCKDLPLKGDGYISTYYKKD